MDSRFRGNYNLGGRDPGRGFYATTQQVSHVTVIYSQGKYRKIPRLQRHDLDLIGELGSKGFIPSEVDGRGVLVPLNEQDMDSGSSFRRRRNFVRNDKELVAHLSGVFLWERQLRGNTASYLFASR